MKSKSSKTRVNKQKLKTLARIMSDFDLEALFVGKTGKKYFGVRYPQGKTIRPPLCVVTVLPVDGKAYLLPSCPAKGYKWDFDWGRYADDSTAKILAGCILRDIFEIAQDDTFPSFTKLIDKFNFAVVRNLPELQWEISTQGVEKQFTAEVEQWKAEQIIQKLGKVGKS